MQNEDLIDHISLIIHSSFYQFKPVVSHPEVSLPDKSPTPKNIGEGLKGPERQLWKEALFVQYDKNKIPAFFQIPSQSNPSLKKKNSSVHSLLLVLRMVNFLINGSLLQATLKMGVLMLK